MMLEESLKDCCPEDDLNPDEPSTPTAEFYIYDSAPLEVGRQSTARINKGAAAYTINEATTTPSHITSLRLLFARATHAFPSESLLLVIGCYYSRLPYKSLGLHPVVTLYQAGGARRIDPRLPLFDPSG
eukprot:693169-Prorocentrum_minimum.AAC.2